MSTDLLAAWRHDPAELFEACDADPLHTLAVIIGRARPGWMARAACARPEHQTVDFFPGKGDARPALAVCSTCPVLDTCREWALDTEPNPLPHGVAAGLTATRRQALRRQRMGARS